MLREDDLEDPRFKFPRHVVRKVGDSERACVCVCVGGGVARMFGGGRRKRKGCPYVLLSHAV